MINPKIKIGQTVWFIDCFNKIFKAKVTEYSFCEGQGALYLILDSPSFRRNKTPCVHYTSCFETKEEAEKCVEYLKEDFMKRCDRCEFNGMLKSS